MKLARTMLALGVCFGALGCKAFSASTPGWDAGGAPLATTATYDVLGETEGDASGGYLFGIFPIGMENKQGVIHGGGHAPQNIFQLFGGTGLNPVEAAAVYNAIEKLPDADAMMAPRFKTEATNYIIFKKLTVKVKGHGVRYNPSAK